MQNSMTLKGGFQGGNHRGLTVQKVENGYVLTCKISTARSPEWEGDNGLRIRESIMVFYTVPEVLDAIRTYLESGKEKIRN